MKIKHRVKTHRDFSNCSLKNRYFYVHDRLGSVRLVVNEDGDVNNSYTYNPFGEMFPTECAETVYNPFKFTGQWFDSEIGQYYLRARMYDPVFMRFTSRDPVRGEYKRPLSLHQYLYCINDPINRIDPLGELGKGYLQPIWEAAWTSTSTVLSHWPKTSKVLGPVVLAIGTAEAGFHSLNILYIRSLQHIVMNEIISWSGIGGAGDPLPVAWDLLFGKNVLEGWKQTGYEYWRLGVEWYSNITRN